MAGVWEPSQATLEATPERPREPPISLAAALGQAMIPVAVRADLGPAEIREDRHVLRRIQFVLRVTGHAGGVDLVPGVHAVRGRAIPAGGPGFIRDVRVARPVTSSAAYARVRVCCGEFLRHVVDMAHETAAVVGGRSVRCSARGLIFQQQRHWRSRFGRLTGQGLRLICRSSLHLALWGDCGSLAAAGQKRPDDA
jgi:hypothetical protein